VSSTDFEHCCLSDLIVTFTSLQIVQIKNNLYHTLFFITTKIVIFFINIVFEITRKPAWKFGLSRTLIGNS
jgi:hypothetical protein